MAVNPNPEPLLVSKVRAAELLSISVDTFERLVMPEVNTVRIGRRVLFAVSDLTRWIDQHAARPLLAEVSHTHRRDPHRGGTLRRSLPPRHRGRARHKATEAPRQVASGRPQHLGGPQDAR